MRELPGSIRFCFQPGEEVLTGARRMIADGVMDGVDAVLGAHLLSPIPFGTSRWRTAHFSPAATCSSSG